MSSEIKVQFQQWSCTAIFGLYDNLRLAIQLLDDEDYEIVATATINLPEEELPHDVILVKNYSENEGIEDALVIA